MKQGTWALPGGWCDVLDSVKSNTEKEVREETGLLVKALKIISIQDRNKHNKPIYAYGICKIFVLCEVIEANLHRIRRQLRHAYFSIEELPSDLAEEKTTRSRSKCAFRRFQMKTGRPCLIKYPLPHRALFLRLARNRIAYLLRIQGTSSPIASLFRQVPLILYRKILFLQQIYLRSSQLVLFRHFLNKPFCDR